MKEIKEYSIQKWKEKKTGGKIRREVGKYVEITNDDGTITRFIDMFTEDDNYSVIEQP